MTTFEEHQEHEKAKDRQRRLEDTTDRAQPSEIDVRRVRLFLEIQAPQVLGSHVEQKLCFLLAQQFNHGFDCGMKHVRAENGYEAGYGEAIEEMRKHLRHMEDEKE